MKRYKKPECKLVLLIETQLMAQSPSGPQPHPGLGGDDYVKEEKDDLYGSHQTSLWDEEW